MSLGTILGWVAGATVVYYAGNKFYDEYVEPAVLEERKKMKAAKAECERNNLYYIEWFNAQYPKEELNDIDKVIIEAKKASDEAMSLAAKAKSAKMKSDTLLNKASELIKEQEEAVVA
jgi:hypothetical protein